MSIANNIDNISNVKHHGLHAHDDHHAKESSVLRFGFWVYILSDLILFATLFANFAVFASSYYGGPHGNTLVEGENLFDLKYVLIETFLLLFSSVTYGFAMIAAHRSNLSLVKIFMGLTFILGAGFIAMEIHEFRHLIHVLHNPILNPSHLISAYFSAFFCLVGTHGLHVTVGLLWIAIMFVQLARFGLNHHNITRLNCLSLFWHFLDIVWIGVFTAVYLLGVL